MPQGFSGVGLVTAYERTVAGLPGRGTDFGNCPKLAISHTPNVVERNSSMDPERGPLRRNTQATAAAIELVCDEFNKANMSRFLLARIDEVEDDTDIDFTFPMSDVRVGDRIKLPHKNVTNVVITDSTAGTAKTLPETAYELDPFDGSLLIKSLVATGGGTITQPLKASFDRGAVTVLSGLALPETEIWLGMSGTNTDTGEPGVLDVYRVRFPVADVMDFITNDYQDFTLKGTVLLDTTKQASDVGGKYYQFVLPATHE